MERIFQYYNNHKILLIIFLFIFSSCSVVRYIGGDKRWINHDLGLSITADSLMRPQNKSYYNERIFKNKTGEYYCFNNDSTSTNYIVWENGWHTIVLFNPIEKQKIYYTYDKKNRLRMLDRFLEHCNCYVTKIIFNKKGKIVYLQNKGISF